MCHCMENNHLSVFSIPSRHPKSCSGKFVGYINIEGANSDASRDCNPVKDCCIFALSFFRQHTFM